MTIKQKNKATGKELLAVILKARGKAANKPNNKAEK